MAVWAVALLFFAPALFQESLKAAVQTQRTVHAEAGDQVVLHCQLTKTTNVLQVTWQRITPDGERNIGTSNERGIRINPEFEGKVEFKDAGLQNTSIVIRELRQHDEGCYRCLFHTYHNGALSTLTCVQLYELHGPVVEVDDTNSSEVVVSCSATGPPESTVTLRSGQHKVNSSKRVHSNTNGTVTVSVTAVLQRLSHSSTEVECAAQVLSAPPKKAFVVIPEAEPTSPLHGSNAKTGPDNTTLTVVIALTVSMSAVFITFILALIFLIRRKRQRRSVQRQDSVVSKTQLKSGEDPDETPEMQKEQPDGLRQRTSSKKKEGNNSPGDPVDLRSKRKINL